MKSKHTFSAIANCACLFTKIKAYLIGKYIPSGKITKRNEYRAE